MDKRKSVQPILPIKLPPAERKKLSLIIESTPDPKSPTQTVSAVKENENTIDEKLYFQYKIEQSNQELDEFRLSNDTYLHLNEEDDTNSSGSNNYYVLNELISRDVLNSDVSNPTLNGQSDDEDEDKYYLPSALVESPTDRYFHYEPEVLDDIQPELVKEQPPPVKPRQLHPQLPKKMNKREFKNSFRTLKGMNRMRMQQDSTINNEDIYYCPLPVQNLSTFESFKREIFRNNYNRKCADCQFKDANNISCLYFVTLCDKCAEMHQKLPHYVNKLYTIDFKSIYNELIKSNELNLQSFLSILHESGNEKMNSLFEYDSSANASRTDKDFIKQKYLNKLFINSIELDSSDNYLSSLNRTFYIEGICIPIIIYNLLIGANINYSILNKSAYDIACNSETETTQKNYLKINNSQSFQSINSQILVYEFKGEILQVYDMNSTIQSLSVINSLSRHPVQLKLDKNSLQLIQTIKNRTIRTDIPYLSIIKIEPNLKLSLIELKWCNKENNSLVSTYFQYSSLNEKHIWLNEFSLKLLSSLNTNQFENNKQNILNLIDLINSCQISLMGFLNLNTNEFNEDDGEPIVALLIETTDIQLPNYYQNKLILINRDESLCIDLRKIKIKLKDNLIRIDYDNRCLILKSHGYIQNLKTWHDLIVLKTQMEFISINDQYLTKENVPTFIEKLCSYVEFNFILNKQYYCNLKLINNKQKLNLIQKLKDVTYEIGADYSLNLFKQYFMAYFTQKHFVLFFKLIAKIFDSTSEPILSNHLDSVTNRNNFTNNKISFSALQKNEYFDYCDLKPLVNLDKLKKFLHRLGQSNSTFYYTLRRIAIHLNLISNYSDKNEMNSQYLSDLFTPLIFHSTSNFNNILQQSLEILQLKPIDLTMCETVSSFFLTNIINCLIENCTLLFNLKENYLKTQIKMIERSFALNKIKMNRLHLDSQVSSGYLITIYIENKSESFQTKIDLDTTCSEVLQSFKQQMDDYCLCEMFDYEQCKSFKSNANLDQIQLIRLLPMNLKLIMNLSKWSCFYLCIRKINLIDSKHLSHEHNWEPCELVTLCKSCGHFKDDLAGDCSLSHNKWKIGYFLIQNDSIKLFKRSSTDTDLTKLKLLNELKLEDLICYYGLYYQSHSEITWTVQNELITDDECLSLFDKKTSSLYCIHFKQKQTALILYNLLFEKYYEQNCCNYLSVFEFVNKRQCAIYCANNESNYATISRILKKIIKK